MRFKKNQDLRDEGECQLNLLITTASTMDDASSLAMWNNILLVRCVRAANDRTWEYFLPIFISHVVTTSSSLSTTALLLAVRCLASLVLLPLFANLWSPSRSLLYAAVENISLVASGISLYWWCDDGDNVSILYAAAVFMAFEQAASKTLTSNVEKHAVVLQSSTPVELSKSNASLVRLDLIVAALVPFAVGLVVVRAGHRNAVPLFIVLQVMTSVLSLPTALKVATNSAGRKSPASGSVVPLDMGGHAPDLWWQTMPSALVLLANALLYFTVVSPNGIMLVWLQNEGLDAFWLAAVSSLGQAAGIVGSLVTPHIIASKGLHRGALLVLVSQILCVGSVAALIVIVTKDENQNSSSSSSSRSSSGSTLILAMTCGLIVMSRVGLWGVDLVLRQMVQETTNDSNRVAVFGMGDSLSQCASLCMYVVVSSDRFTFSSLAIGSTCSLIGALVCVWMQMITVDRKV